jgi:hypothetical protein
MADQAATERFSELLHFNPKIWWDPVPWWFVHHLDRTVLKELAVIQIELQREVLAIQSKSLERTLAVIAKAGK